jgi:pimeloyl-ACP methyl ester carboxylesterase
MNKLHRIAAAVTLSCAVFAAPAAVAAPAATQASAAPASKNVVLVHGFFADGSGWRGVADILARDGYQVSVVQLPETSLADDVNATNRAIDALPGRVTLVGHSYGGMVISEAGNNAKVASLVYVAAFLPEAGESLKDLADKMPPATKGIMATADGHLAFDAALFHADFAADIAPADARFMARAQVMPALRTAGDRAGAPAWKNKPSWAIVSSADRTVNPALERFMAQRAGSKVSEIAGSHAAFIAHPAQVARVIEQAAAVSVGG